MYTGGQAESGRQNRQGAGNEIREVEILGKVIQESLTRNKKMSVLAHKGSKDNLAQTGKDSA